MIKITVERGGTVQSFVIESDGKVRYTDYLGSLLVSKAFVALQFRTLLNFNPPPEETFQVDLPSIAVKATTVAGQVSLIFTTPGESNVTLKCDAAEAATLFETLTLYLDGAIPNERPPETNGY